MFESLFGTAADPGIDWNTVDDGGYRIPDPDLVPCARCGEPTGNILYDGVPICNPCLSPAELRHIHSQRD